VFNALRTRHGAAPVNPVVADLCAVLPEFLAAVAPYRSEYALSAYRDRDTWLSKFPLGKQRALRQSALIDPIKPTRVKAMIKLEVYHKAITRARLIQFYPNLATQGEFGPQFYSLQKAITACFQQRQMPGGIDITFGSGMNAVAIGQWMDDAVLRGAVRFYERDGKNWDSTLLEATSRFRQTIYAAFDVELAQFARKCNNVRGSAPFSRWGVVRYLMRHTVKSGHNDTTTGNSLVNAGIIYAVMRRLGYKGSIIVTGDDLLVALHGKYDCHKIEQLEREYGIQPECRIFEEPTHVSFVSGIFLRCHGKFLFTPMPGRLLARLWWSVNPPPPRHRNAMLRGIARGLLPCIRGLPIVGAFVGNFDSEGAADYSRKYMNYHGCAHDFGDDIVANFSERYGLEPSAIVECDAWIKSLPPCPLFLVHPVLTRMMEVDLADIGDRDWGDCLW